MRTRKRTTVKGGCGFVADDKVITSGSNQGFVYATAVSREASGPPSAATVSCLASGYIAGAVAIDPDGDLYVAQPEGPGYVKVYDCRPYQSGAHRNRA